jgi:hypothetical protein
MSNLHIFDNAQDLIIHNDQFRNIETTADVYSLNTINENFDSNRMFVCNPQMKPVSTSISSRITINQYKNKFFEKYPYLKNILSQTVVVFGLIFNNPSIVNIAILKLDSQQSFWNKIVEFTQLMKIDYFILIKGYLYLIIEKQIICVHLILYPNESSLLHSQETSSCCVLFNGTDLLFTSLSAHCYLFNCELIIPQYYSSNSIPKSSNNKTMYFPNLNFDKIKEFTYTIRQVSDKVDDLLYSIDEQFNNNCKRALLNTNEFYISNNNNHLNILYSHVLTITSDDCFKYLSNMKSKIINDKVLKYHKLKKYFRMTGHEIAKFIEDYDINKNLDVLDEYIKRTTNEFNTITYDNWFNELVFYNVINEKEFYGEFYKEFIIDYKILYFGVLENSNKIKHRDCAICQDVIEDSNIAILDCNHVFHLSNNGRCKGLLEMFSRNDKKCPLCRQNYYDIDKEEVIEVPGVFNFLRSLRS